MINRTLRITLVVTVLALLPSGLASAATITLADYGDDFQGPAPTPGWSYLWNSLGSIGNPANYTPLLWTGSVFDNDGVPGVPGADPGAWVWLGATDGHPGRGTSQGTSVDRYAIAAFTLSTSGQTALTNSTLQTTNACLGSDLANGVALQVFVNATPSLGAPLLVDRLSSASFNMALGNLSAGDTIYVAVGPNTRDFCDGFTMDFTIQQDQSSVMPEPSTLGLFVTGACGLLRRRRRLARLGHAHGGQGAHDVEDLGDAVQRETSGACAEP